MHELNSLSTQIRLDEMNHVSKHVPHVDFCLRATSQPRRPIKNVFARTWDIIATRWIWKTADARD